MANSSESKVTYLDTEGMTETVKSIKDNATKFNLTLQRIESVQSRLYASWLGKARNEFEGQYAIIFRQLSDLEKGLIQVYDALVKSQVAYYDADQKLGKDLVM